MSQPAEKPDKSYGLMGVVKGSSPKVVQNPVEMVFSWPNLVVREAIAFFSLVSVLSLISVFFDSPLEEIANPAVTPNPAKAPWYFLGLQELLHNFPPLVAGVILPGVAVVALLLVPYIDRNPSRRWRDRKLAITIFMALILGFAILTLIGVFFRGPGWSWTWPWKDGIY